MPKRISTTERGYGAEHQAERERWAPHVQAGQILCHARTCLMPSRVIYPDTAWDLGHNPERTAWTGPEHSSCNRSEGATRGNRMRGTVAPIAARPKRWAL